MTLEAGDTPDKMEAGDVITFDAVGPLSDVYFHVVDTTTEDLGITEVVGVILQSDVGRYAIEWATHSETVDIVSLTSDDEWEIEVTDIVVVNDE